ncbi:MAG: M15 family peptidase, partial [Verrucomicrobiaceae bacterium]
VVKRAIELTTIDFKVGEGVRTPARQKKLVAEGKSKTLNSRHLVGKDGFGKAVDLWTMPKGTITWEQKDYNRLSKFMFRAAEELDVDIRWGGDFNGNGDINDGWYDGPHYELVAKKYP